MLKATVQSVNLDQLFFDPNNYRLINEKNYTSVSTEHIRDDLVQKRTLNMLCGQKNENIKDLLESFKANSYLPVDQIQVRTLGDNGYLVLEGNRRTAALKVLKSEYETNAIDIGNFDVDIFKQLPVVVYEGADNEIQHLIVMGLKHISGNKKWGEWNQAKYIKTLYDSHTYTEEELCHSIGIEKAPLRKNLRALSFIDQYLDSDFGDQFSESLFPVFREIVSNSAMKEWLGWSESTYKAENVKNMERLFALLSKIENDEEEESQFLDAAITKREEIRVLGKFITDEKALSELEQRRSVSEAYNISKAGVKEQLQQPIQQLMENLENNITALKQLQLSKDKLKEAQRLSNVLQNYISEKNIGIDSSLDLDVFFSRIEKHFSAITIGSYKHFSNLKIEHLKRINIFAGNNNIGKTSLLEAIYLLCYQNAFEGLYEVVRRRGKISDAKMDMKWLSGQVPSSIHIAGEFDSLQGAVVISHLREDTSEFDSTGYIETLKLESTFNNVKQESRIRLFTNKDYSTHTEDYKIICPIVFSSPFFLNEPSKYARFYAKSVQAKDIDKIISFIRKNVLPKIKDIRLVDELQRFTVNDDSFPIGMDLSSYGEGVQRIFFISLMFASAEHGVLLIDEFENAVHVGLLSSFAGFIEELAKEFDVQVFLTSHSKECIDAFVFNIKDIDEVTYTALFDDDGKVTARQYAGKEYKRLVKIADTDLRTEK